MGMGEDSDVRSPGVIRVLRAEQHTVKRMEEGGGANIWDAPKVPRVRQSIA